jgi:organic hydroperoxide reductase OsmC/OhrA
VQLTADHLNRATLDRQSLLRRKPGDVVAAVRAAVAVQAQSPASPYIGLWNRMAGFDPAELDAAFTSYDLVRGNPIRMTLHAVAADEYRPFREATEPSLYAAKLGGRIADSGIAAKDAAVHADDILEFAVEIRTARDCENRLADRLGAETAKAVWPGIRQYAPLLRVPLGGPWTFNEKVAYLAAPDRPALGDRDAADAALENLILRYLSGFGPASVADVAQFAMVQRGRVTHAVKALGDRLQRYEGPNGEKLYDLPDATVPDPETPAPPRLMAMWDNVFLAYFDRTRTVPADLRTTLIRNNGDVLPMILVDGRAAGVWRATAEGIEATAFRPLADEDWVGLAAEAEALAAFLADRDPAVYSRYHHWWKRLPAGETVRLAARLGFRLHPRDRKERAMTGREHHYEVTMRWTGNTGKGTANYREYGRDHDLIVEGKPVIQASADPAFRGQPERWNPEELLVASLADCHMLTYLALCALERIVVTSYEDTATGTMLQDGNGGRFTEVTLAPVVTIADPEKADRAMALHHDASKDCFIANSVNFPVHHNPTILAGLDGRAGHRFRDLVPPLDVRLEARVDAGAGVEGAVDQDVAVAFALDVGEAPGRGHREVLDPDLDLPPVDRVGAGVGHGHGDRDRLVPLVVECERGRALWTVDGGLRGPRRFARGLARRRRLGGRLVGSGGGPVRGGRFGGVRVGRVARGRGGGLLVVELREVGVVVVAQGAELPDGEGRDEQGDRDEHEHEAAVDSSAQHGAVHPWAHGELLQGDRAFEAFAASGLGCQALLCRAR